MKKLKSEERTTLINLLIYAHQSAASHNLGNLSTAVAKTTYIGSTSYLQAIAAGVLSLGGAHAPITKCRKLLQRMASSKPQDFELHIMSYIRNGKRVPGFGHSFYKDQIDPSFARAYNEYCSLSGEDNKITEMQNHLDHCLFRCEKTCTLYPNAALITAACAELIGLEPGMEMGIALQGRIPVWIVEINKMKGAK